MNRMFVMLAMLVLGGGTGCATSRSAEAMDGGVTVHTFRRSFRGKLGLLTANATTPYLLAFANLGRTGPLVIDVPEGPTAGGVLDFWQRPASDLGLTGPDRGAGGRYVAVGPGQTPPLSIPSARTIATATLNILVGTRILATAPTEAASLKEAFRLYPAAHAHRPPKGRIIRPDGRGLERSAPAWARLLGARRPLGEPGAGSRA